MASLINAAFCAIVATAFWSLLGYALARHIFPRPVAIGAAPVLGWAVQNAATLPIFFLIGFSPVSVIGVGAWGGGRRFVCLGEPATQKQTGAGLAFAGLLLDRPSRQPVRPT